MSETEQKENFRIQEILENSIFLINYKKIQNFEAGRGELCRHDLGHFLDVARIAYIYNLENELGFRKDVIYAAGLLHDIGKWRQYEDGTPHELASAEIAGDILRECGYSVAEIEIIINSIINHRRDTGNENSFNQVVYYADKKSRNCFYCSAVVACSRDTSKRNNLLIY